MSTTTTQDNFSAMRGHAAEGVTVRMRDGDVLTVTATIRGWQLRDSQNRPFGFPTTSAHVLECLIYVHPSEEI